MIACTVYGWAQGIIFEEGTFAQAIDKSLKESKLLFLYFYTDWCSPCSQMSANVFTQERVGELFNKNHVNIKINAEKGEGVALAAQFEVSAYPAMFFVNPKNGKAIHRISGYKDEDQLLDQAHQIEEAGKYGGLEQMKDDFNSGRNDIEFLSDYFKALSDSDPQRSVIAARYLLHIPAHDFKSEEQEQMSAIDDMIQSLSEWNDDVMYRLLQLFDQKQRERGAFPPAYSLRVVFSVEIKTGRFIQQAIDKGDEQLLEKTLQFQHEHRSTLHRGQDKDIEIKSGRGIFFASPEFIHLEYLVSNKNDPEKFKADMVIFMRNLMAIPINPPIPTDDSDSTVALMKQSAEHAAYFIRSRNWSNDLSIEYIIKWANYYWRVMPSDQETKDSIAGWLNFACALNPYSVVGAKNTAPLLVKVGRSKDAIDNLENVLNAYRRFHLDTPQYVKGVADMIDDIKNDKL